MDNKNNSKKVKNNSNINNIQSSSLSKPKSKMTMLSFILLITIGMVLLATLISHFENEPDTDKDGSKYLKPIVCFSFVAACIYLIYKNMNDKKISILGYTIERGLFIYMFVILMFAFLI